MKPPSRESGTATAREQVSRVLIAEDDPRIARLLQTMLEADGYHVSVVGNGEEAIAAVAEEPPDIVLTDVAMPRMDGIEVCQRLKSDERTRLIPVVMITALTDLHDRLRGIEAGADDYLGKPFNRPEVSARVRSLLHVKRLNDELDRAEDVIYTLARAIEAKDRYTEGHTERVARFSTALGEWLGHPVTEIEVLRQGGVLHDVGKIGVPDAILNKPGQLTRAEFEVIKCHPVRGWEICRGLRSLKQMLPIIRWHHERLDGSGYPDGLGGEEIPTIARIAAVTDVFDALTTRRSYKPPFPLEDCFRILREEADRGWWDKDITEGFIDLIQAKGVGVRPDNWRHDKRMAGSAAASKNSSESERPEHVPATGFAEDRGKQSSS